MVRLLICCRDGHSEAYALCGGRHCSDNCERLVHWPLSSGADRSIKVSVVHIVAAFFVLADAPKGLFGAINTQYVGNEYAVELGFLQQLCQFYPMLDIVELMRTVIWVSP